MTIPRPGFEPCRRLDVLMVGPGQDSQVPTPPSAGTAEMLGRDCRRCGLTLPSDLHPAAIYHGGPDVCFEYVFRRLNEREMDYDQQRAELRRLAAENEGLRARCEELAARLVGVEAVHLADEWDIHHLRTALATARGEVNKADRLRLEGEERLRGTEGDASAFYGAMVRAQNELATLRASQQAMAERVREEAES